jgi:L-fucose isomerase
MAKSIRLNETDSLARAPMTFGLFATCDPRVDEAARTRSRNIVGMVADAVAANVKMPGGEAARVVWSPVLVDDERGADIVAQQFREAGVQAIVCAPDTWAFPQPGLISLIQQFPRDVPLNLTCGNSGPKPGVVFTHAASGAISQYGRLVHINVGNWPDVGSNPQMSEGTTKALADWAYAALAAQSLKGRRVVIWGHDSMGMETALAHVIATRNTFGIEITRLDMKLLADMLRKKSYKAAELRALRGWVDRHLGKRLAIRGKPDSERFNQSLAMYLIMRDVMRDLNAVGGGFMSQLEWGSDVRGIPLPVADAAESLFNSTFDHTGRRAPIPYATEADVQGLLTMLLFSHLTGGNPPLFMDFRKVWEAWEIRALAEKLGVAGLNGRTLWEQKGFVDGDNSGSASFDWAASPGASVEEIMSKVAMPPADPNYFPGRGNSVTFVTPAGIEGIAGRLAYSAANGMFSLSWDEAVTAELPEKLSVAVCKTSTPEWPHTFVVPKYATMGEYKQYAPANHFHMIWGLSPARLEYWMDLTNVLSATPWANRPCYVEGADRPSPLLHILNGGEAQAKMLLASR